MTLPAASTTHVFTILLTRLPPPKVICRFGVALGPPADGDTYFSPIKVTLVVNPAGIVGRSRHGRSEPIHRRFQRVIGGERHPANARALVLVEQHYTTATCHAWTTGTVTLIFVPSPSTPLSFPPPVVATVNVPYPISLRNVRIAPLGRHQHHRVTTGPRTWIRAGCTPPGRPATPT